MGASSQLPFAAQQVSTVEAAVPADCRPIQIKHPGPCCCSPTLCASYGQPLQMAAPACQEAASQAVNQQTATPISIPKTKQVSQQACLQAPYIPQTLVRTAVTAGLRFSNCYFGGIQWMWFMGKIGLQ